MCMLVFVQTPLYLSKQEVRSKFKDTFQTSNLTIFSKTKKYMFIQKAKIVIIGTLLHMGKIKTNQGTSYFMTKEGERVYLDMDVFGDKHPVKKVKSSNGWEKSKFSVSLSFGY